MVGENEEITEEIVVEKPKEENVVPEKEKPIEPSEDEDIISNKLGTVILDKLAELLSKGRVTINLILYTLLGIIITPFVDSLRMFMGTGISDFSQFFDVIKYVAAPFVMLIATKRIMDDLAKKGADTDKELVSCKNELMIVEQSKRDENQKTALEKERMKSKYELELKMREGIVSLKNYEINRLNSDIDRYKKDISLMKQGTK